LDVRRIRENQAKKVLGEEVKHLRDRQMALEEAETLKLALDHRFQGLSRSGRLDPVFFRRYQSYQMTLGGDVGKKRSEVGEQNSVVDEARAALQLTRRKTQVFEKLEELSREAYLLEYRKEEEKLMSEVALSRFRRKAESGKASLVLMAICTSGFIMGVLTIALLFAVGSLNLNRMELIAQILRYREDLYKDSKMVVGHGDPYIVKSEDYQAMLESAKSWGRVLQKEEFEALRKGSQAWMKAKMEDVDDDVVITKEVLDHRRDLLHRIEETLKRTREEAGTSLSEISARESQLENAKKALAEERKNLTQVKEDKADERKEKAQEEMLAAFKSMDPEEVVKVLTAGKQLMDFANLEQQQAAVAKVADYMGKMGARQRAGILQALSPEWSATVVRYLEGSPSL
jgi:flagellar export protein FliJ